MEQYKIATILPKPIKFGIFQETTYRRHVVEYGKENAEKILKTCTNILRKSINQFEDIHKTNNVLLVGKVQSGKTSNLEMISSLAFDNEYNLLVIYGGYDSTLLKQSVGRFCDCFSEHEDNICILSTENTNFEKYDENFFKSKFDEGVPIIIASMKRPTAMEKVNDCLKRISNFPIKAIIIDDEGDQASLNTEIKENSVSATYNCICRMKKYLKDPLYFAVTATPQANIFQPDISELKPDAIHLIRPGNKYTGANEFHLSEDKIYVVDKEDLEDIDSISMNKSLKKSIYHYIISSSIMLKRNIKSSDMIIHSFREINGQSAVFEVVYNFITDIKDCISNDSGLDVYLNEMKKCYLESKCFKDSIRQQHSWESIEKCIKKVMSDMVVLQHNSKNQYNNDSVKYLKHQIHIGGDLLQRGITFKNLVTTYFTRWAKSGNMDTTLQRARWFGYREKIIDLCKIFTSEVIKKEFANLAAVESDLWEQFNMIEDGQLSISDIVIDANDTSLNPTRKNVVKYKKAVFAKKWSKQKNILTDSVMVKRNNELFLRLIGKYDFMPSTVGRNDGKTSTYYATIDLFDFVDYIKQTNYVFDQKPFSKQDLFYLLQKEKDVVVELLTSYNDLVVERTRSAIDGSITYLQQGPDSSDSEKKHYDGDSAVIVDKNKIIIQASMVVPIINEEKRDELGQYMFAIHFPKKTIVYSK